MSCVVPTVMASPADTVGRLVSKRCISVYLVVVMYMHPLEVGSENYAAPCASPDHSTVTARATLLELQSATWCTSCSWAQYSQIGWPEVRGGYWQAT